MDQAVSAAPPQTAGSLLPLHTPLVRRHVDGAIVRLEIANPAQKNAVRPEMSRALAAWLDLAAADPACRVVLLHGEAGDFCAGGDVLAIAAQQARPPAEQIERLGAINELIRAMRRCAKPIVAAVEGNAAGAGFSIALAADFVVASRISRFAVAHVRLGISPDGGITAALPRMLPAPLANEMLLMGKPVSAERLHAAGLVNSLAEPGHAVQAATQLARELAGGAIGAMGRIKELVNTATWSGLDAQLEAERRHFVEAMFGDEAREGVNAFVEKRQADFAGCSPGR